MTYRLIQLAPGSYDVLLDEEIVASAVRSTSRKAAIWTAGTAGGGACVTSAGTIHEH